jgi:hypothetical protein
MATMTNMMRDIESSRRRAGRRALVVAASVAATLLAAPGLAQAQLPSEPGAVDQYVEDVPAGGGKEHPGTSDPSTASLPADVADRIASEGGSDAPLLEELATSSAYGAPQSSLRDTSSADDGDREASADEDESEGASGVFSSAFTAAEGGDSKRLLGLLLALLAISVATIVAVAARQRRSDDA